LPNDQRVVQQKGSKRVMLKNVQGGQVSQRAPADCPADALSIGAVGREFRIVSFTHIVAHELMHGLGPHQIKVDGRDTTVRNELKEVYGAIEEAKADITGLFALQYMMDHAAEMKCPACCLPTKRLSGQLYTTYMASMSAAYALG